MYDERLRDASYDLAGREGVLAVAGRHGPFGNRRGDVRGVRGDELVSKGIGCVFSSESGVFGGSRRWRGGLCVLIASEP